MDVVASDKNEKSSKNSGNDSVTIDYYQNILINSQSIQEILKNYLGMELVIV